MAVRPRLFWLRAFNAGYNPTMAPRVVGLLAQGYPNVELAMCGPDSGDGSFQATRRLAYELGVEERIAFPGKISKERIRELGLECDIFVNTTNYDNTPVSMIEALAMGMCVVSTSVGGIPYLVDHQQDALLVPPNDPDAMAAACGRLLSHPDLAQRLSRNGRPKAESFDWHNLGPRWRALLWSLHTASADRR
jgi:glycosyltransferase involved in cell wall biosynthesis